MFIHVSFVLCLTINRGIMFEKGLFLFGSEESFLFLPAKRASWAFYLRYASVKMNVPV